MKAKGEVVYKAAERIKRYGVKAFVKMLGATARKKRGGTTRLTKYYTAKYPSAPLSIKPTAPYISRSQRSYWHDVKSLAEARKIPIKSSRKILKRLKTAKNVQVRVIKHGEGFQLVMLGLYELKEEEEGESTQSELEYFKEIGIKRPDLEEQLKRVSSIGNQQEATGHSYVHKDQDYNGCLGECIAEAQAVLGGSGWQLIKVLKETWIRYYGREQ